MSTEPAIGHTDVAEAYDLVYPLMSEDDRSKDSPGNHE